MKTNQSVNEKNSKVVSISMEKALFEEFEKLRKERGISRSLLIQLLLIKWMKEQVQE